MNRNADTSVALASADRETRKRAASGREPRIQKLRVTRQYIVADLTDGRIIKVPLAWSWRLSEATPAQRSNFQITPSGYGVHWPDVDEDLSAEGMLNGTPAPRPRSRNP